MSRADTFLWALLPYVALTSFVVGHIWRYRRDGYTWTARSTQLLERRLLFVGSLAFHLGILGVIGGHVIGILVPESWTTAIGISEHFYHWMAMILGGAAGLLLCLGAVVLVYRRLKIDRIRATTLSSDWVMYPLLSSRSCSGCCAPSSAGCGRVQLPRDGLAVVPEHLHAAAEVRPDGECAVPLPGARHYRVAPLRRLAVHAAVHVWSVPVGYLARSPIVYRAKRGATRTALR